LPASWTASSDHQPPHPERPDHDRRDHMRGVRAYVHLPAAPPRVPPQGTPGAPHDHMGRGVYRKGDDVTHAQAQRRQTLRCIAGAAFVALLMILAPLRVSYGERQYCKANTLNPPASFLRDSNYLGANPPLSPYGVWYGPSGRRYGFSLQEDTPIYPTIQTAERCS